MERIESLSRAATRRAALMWARLWRASAWVVLAWSLVGAFGPGSAAVAQEVSGQYRAKINSVDVSKAPNVKVKATFLSREDFPINPELIDQYDVFINDKRVSREKVVLTTWADETNRTDLVIILPALEPFGKEGKDAVANAMKEMLKGLNGEDRVGLIVYTRAVRVLQELEPVDPALVKFYKDQRQRGLRPFMFSSLNKAISLLEASPTGRKKAIVYVGDGTDASTLEVLKVNEKLKETVTRARKANIGIWTVGYTPSLRGLDAVDVRSLQLLSRKTSATYRQANSLSDLLLSLDDAIGEIIGELVLSVRYDFEAETMYDFKVNFQSAFSDEVETPVYKQKVGKLVFNALFWGIVSGILCLLSVVGIVGLIVLVRSIRKQRMREEAEKELDDLLFADDEEEAAGPPPFVFDDDGKKYCNTCGRRVRKDAEVCPYDDTLDPLPEWVDQKKKEASLLGDQA